MPRTIRILVAVAIAITTFHTGQAHAISQRKLCRMACSDEIQACVEWGEGKRRCKRRIVRECRREGLQRCGAEPSAVRAGKGWALFTPESPAATAVSSNAIDVTWLDTNTQESGYEVERSANPNGPFALIGSTGIDATSYRDGSLPAGVTRYYRVRAFRERNRRTVYSWYSIAVGATTFGGGAVPTTTTTSTSSSSTSTFVTSSTTPSTSSTTSTTIAQTNQLPVAKAGPDRAGTAGSSITFDGRASFDPDGVLTAHIWILGDGSPAVLGEIVTHAFDSAGTYDVTLWVRDDVWAWDSDVVRVTVSAGSGSTTTTSSSSTTSTSTSSSSSSTTSTSNSSTSSSTSSSTTSTSSSSTSPSTAASTTSSSTSTSSSTLPNVPPMANAGPAIFTQTLTTVTFDGRASADSDGNIMSWSWAFSDGGTAQGSVVSHAFQTPGQHSATLTVVDDDGASDNDVASVQASNRPPVAVAGPDRGALPGSPVSFDGSGSYDLDGTITNWIWDFGDGATAAGASVSHAYQQAGTFTATLAVSDDAGGVAFDTATVMVSSPAGGEEWTKRLGGTGTDTFKAVAVDASGNVVVAGMFTGSMVVDGTTLSSAGSTDGFVAKYSPAGDVLWLNAFGGADPDSAESVAIDAAGNILVAGGFGRSVSFGGPSLTSRGGSDIFVVKYSPTGAHLWSRSYGDTLNDTAYGVAVDGSGNVVLTGYFTGTVNFGAASCSVPFQTDSDTYLLKLSAGGTPTWVRCFFNTAAEVGNAVAIDAAGAIYFTGSYNGRINLGGSEFDSVGIMNDMFLAKFSSAGVHLWSRSAGDDENDHGRGLAMDSSGNVFVVGTFRGSTSFGGGQLQSNGGSADAFLAKYSSSGSHQWSRRLGGPDDDEGMAVTVDAAGEPTFTGFHRGTMDAGGGPLVSQGLRDIFLVRFSAGGTHRASTSWGGSSDDRGLAVAAAPSGHVVAAGLFQNTASFGGVSLTSAGGPDACLVQRDF